MRGGRVVAGGLAAAALAGILAWLALRGAPVRLQEVRRQPLVQTVVVSGRVAAASRASLGVTGVGRVAEVAVREGDRAKAGDVLVRLDDREAAAALAQARAALDQARARQDSVREVGGRVLSEDARQARAALDLAQRRHDRVAALAAQGAAPSDELDQAQTALEQARARASAAGSQARGSTSPAGPEARAARAALEAARAAVEAAEARLEQTRVRAPADGTVLARAVEPGDVVSPGTALLAFAADGPPYLVAEPDEKNLRLLREGQEAVASADAFPGTVFPARVARILPAVDRQRGTVEVRLDLPSPPAFLRPDMTVSVEVVALRREDALSLPEEAVHDASGESPWAFVAVDGRARKRPLKLGIRGDDRVEALEGVAEGDRVVVGDVSRLADGTRVRPAPP